MLDYCKIQGQWIGSGSETSVEKDQKIFIILGNSDGKALWCVLK